MILSSLDVEIYNEVCTLSVYLNISTARMLKVNLSYVVIDNQTMEITMLEMTNYVTCGKLLRILQNVQILWICAC